MKKEEVVQLTDFGVKPKQVHKTPVVYYQGKDEPAPLIAISEDIWEVTSQLLDRFRSIK